MREAALRAGSRRAAAATLAALTLLYLLLILPNSFGAMTPGALRFFPLEFPAIVLLLAALRGRAVTIARAALTLALTVMLVIKLADIATDVAYLRLFNPLLDLHLLPAAWRMLSGAAGTGLALAVFGGAVVAAGLAGGIIWWATGRVARLDIGQLPAAALALPALVLVWLDAARPLDINPPGAAFTTRLAAAHLRFAAETRQDLARFRCEAANDPYRDAAPPDLLGRLRDRDVLLVVIESYGRAALDERRYAPEIRSALSEAAPRLAAAGLGQRSAYLTSPVVGGLSWLAHASLLTGLWIDSQASYRALLDSDRLTLLHLAQRAGWTTAAVMPAITLNWPEAASYGYDVILDAEALDYRGPPFNWVIMPDQFTLRAFERQLLDRGPVFAEIALISSHAPWTPVPDLLPWDAIADGREFADFARRGDPPEVVWRDSDRVRHQYRLALRYALSTALDFAERRAPTAPLIVIVGDHQPAPFVSGSESRDVPVHLIGPPDVLAATDVWGWSPGLIPDEDAPVWRMDDFRDRFLDAFSEPAALTSRNLPTLPRFPSC